MRLTAPFSQGLAKEKMASAVLVPLAHGIVDESFCIKKILQVLSGYNMPMPRTYLTYG